MNEHIDLTMKRTIIITVEAIIIGTVATHETNNNSSDMMAMMEMMIVKSDLRMTMVPVEIVAIQIVILVIH